MAAIAPRAASSPGREVPGCPLAGSGLRHRLAFRTEVGRVGATGVTRLLPTYRGSGRACHSSSVTLLLPRLSGVRGRAPSRARPCRRLFDTDMRLYAATGDAIACLDEGDFRWSLTLTVEGSGAQCLAVDPRDGDVLYVGLRSNGVRKSSDGGATWIDCELPAREVFSLAVSPADGAVYAGCEPSALFKSNDGGRTWSELDSLLELPSRTKWRFPPRPWTSHVRWIAPSPHDADRLLVGIELGGLIRSTDGGVTWQDHRPGAQRDVHSLAWHPRVPGRAYEAGGGGAAWSSDGGDTWQPADEGRDRHYTWSVAVDPVDPDRWYLSASTGPMAAHRGGDPEAQIYSRQSGGLWEQVTGGLPDPLPAMPYALVTTGARVFAGLSDGQVWESSDRGETWRSLEIVGTPVGSLVALAAAER
jgi:hypothetical protein